MYIVMATNREVARIKQLDEFARKLCERGRSKDAIQAAHRFYKSGIGWMEMSNFICSMMIYAKSASQARLAQYLVSEYSPFDSDFISDPTDDHIAYVKYTLNTEIAMLERISSTPSMLMVVMGRIRHLKDLGLAPSHYEWFDPKDDSHTTTK